MDGIHRAADGGVAFRSHFTQDPYGPLRVWSPPAESTEYIVGVDTAEGIVRDRNTTNSAAMMLRDDKPDYSCAQVVELESGVHVASWWGDISPTDWAYVVAALAYYYNRALLIVEINGPGLEVQNTLAKRVRYPNLYRNRMPNRAVGDDYASSWGWRTGPHNRPQLMARIEELLQSGIPFTRDKETLDEIQIMEKDQRGAIRARAPNHDDRVLALALALQARWERMYDARPEAPRDTSLDHLPAADRAVWRSFREHMARYERNTHGGIRIAGGRFVGLGRRPRGRGRR